MRGAEQTMSSLFERMMALNTRGPFRAERVDANSALKGGKHPVLPNPQPNAVLGTPLVGANDPAWDGRALDEIVLGMGCFWGAERMFWDVDGVVGTSVGYAGGWTQNPTYREVCTGRTGHAEVVRVVFDPEVVSVEEILKIDFENHNPTQGDRQGNDVGSQYRSAVYTSSPEQQKRAEAAVAAWKQRFVDAGLGEVTTEVSELVTTGNGHYYLAEDEHQQYLHKNPGGYCNHGPNGVSCPVGVI